jgi:hypothetical protein
MINSLYRAVKRISSGKWVAIFFILFMIIAYLNIGKPFGIEQLEEITGGVGALDEMFYTPESAYEVLDKQGEAGRQFYQQLLLTTEIIFPFIYRMFNAVFIAFLFSRFLPPKSKLNYLCLAPIIGMIADYIENSLILTMLFNYPERLYAIANTASVITIIKWVSNYADWTLITLGIIGAVLAYILKKRKANK